MKKYFLYIGIIIFVLGTMSCNKQFDTYHDNLNAATNVPAYLLLRQIENDMFDVPGDNDKACQYTLSSYTYYGDNRYWSGSANLNYGTLRNVAAMEEVATKASGSNINPYVALGKFFRAYFFVKMTLKVGDLPMTEALGGLENSTPKYDSQKQIFIQSLQLLEEANTQLSSLIAAANTGLLGDFYYQERISNAKTSLESLKQWQKVVNTFKLRVLIELSKKESDGELNIKQKFSDVISNPAKYPIMADGSDNLEYVYNQVYNHYTNNKDNYGNDALRLTVASTWLNTLAGLNDLRAMKIADPARGLGFPDTSYKAFVGASIGEDLGTMGTKVVAGKYALFGRKRYYDGLTGENTFIVSYQEMCLNIAEAINRGWISGDANSWYQKGIKASFAFYGVNDGKNTVSFLRTYLPGDYINYDIIFNYNDYFNQPTVKYAGNNATGLNQILTQKYLAMARSTGLEPYYQWRRTGVPAFAVGSGVGNGGVIPLRFQYPATEFSTNGSNVKAAVQSQYGGNDDINGQMWILK